ncbi:MAG: peptide-methionine (R)-S-oxide reductase MsrB [Thermodesulfobacteriota bacterium]|nr:peptide-methionine (R)-S-oxide reductase MsrB [Thermodesulfobacteriota bacterium]
MRIRQIIFFALGLALVLGFAAFCGAEKSPTLEAGMTENKNISTITLAGGCFWCLEADMEKIPGVIEAVSGYAGGEVVNPTYKQVSTGTTGHREAVRVRFDPAKVSVDQILDTFFRHIDPTDADGSFADRGFQYTSAVFYHDEAQKAAARAVKARIEASGKFKKPVATEILPFINFFPAEEYHQNYHQKNSMRYKAYRHFSGREEFMRKLWGDEPKPLADPKPCYIRPNDKELKKRLSPLQYEVVRNNGTEAPFHNEYWDNHRPGIYVDIATGEPLFSSLDKFDSGTGWPSFTRPLTPKSVTEREDKSLFSTRTEVRSQIGDSHLGHVFPDGPKPTGRRYCINSAALKFIPVKDLEKEGYGEYRKLFKK